MQGGDDLDLEPDSGDDRPDRRRWEVGREHKGLSLLEFLDSVAGPVDRSRLQATARTGGLLLNGEPTSPGTTLRIGDLVELDADPARLVRPSERQVAVLHEGDGLLVADKPSGVPFSEGRRPGHSALEQLRVGRGRLRPLHKLDKETSGVVVVATDPAVEEAVTAEFQGNAARIEYLAVVRGNLHDDGGRIEVPLGKRRRSDVRLEPDPDRGDPAATDWEVVERLRGFALLRLVPREGGRSHQVRCHLAAAGFPALCDALYGEDDRLLLSQLKLDYRGKRGRPERPLLARPALHAARFTRPGLAVESPLPAELEVVLAQLRRLRPLR